MENQLSGQNPEITGNIQVDRDEKGRFIEGVSGNPAGKPKGIRHLSTMLEEAIKRVAEGGTESYDVLLIKRVLKKAIGDGDMKAIEHIWDRIEGKPPQDLNLGNKDDLPFILKIVQKNGTTGENS